MFLSSTQAPNQMVANTNVNHMINGDSSIPPIIHQIILVLPVSWEHDKGQPHKQNTDYDVYGV